MSPLKLVSLSFLCSFSHSVDAFHLFISKGRKDTAFLRSHHEVTSCSNTNLKLGRRSLALDSLAATIYTWDDNNGGHKGSMYPSDSYNDADTSQSTALGTNVVTELLRHDREKIATLARLAVAHCSDSSLSLESIHDVYVTNVDNTHIEISVSVCDDESCVTVLVPVEFLNPCSASDGSDMISCVLDNILNLDELALQAVALKNINDQMYSDDFILNEFRNQANIDYPKWWIHAQDMNHYRSHSLHSDTQAFHDMKALLNKENFKDEINHFAQQLLLRDGHAKLRPMQSRVTAVGPAGLCLRSMVVNHMANSDQVSIIEVSHRFDEAVFDSESLRQSVLAALN